MCEPEGYQVFAESDQTVSWETIPPESTPMEAESISTARWKWTTATCILTQGIAPVGTFRDYIDTLPEWEQELLLHTALVSDAYVVGVALEHGLRAVSDGSEWFQTQGSFGWILSSDLGERLASGMGQAQSRRSNSYRSEGYGMLALLLFLQRLAKFIQYHDQWNGIIATDSKSLIDTIRGKCRSQTHSGQAKEYQRPLNPMSP